MSIAHIIKRYTNVLSIFRYLFRFLYGITQFYHCFMVNKGFIKLYCAKKEKQTCWITLILLAMVA